MAKIEVDCEDCEGTGTVQVSACKNRGPWQECCGGCVKDADCEACGGTGKVEEEAEEEESLEEPSCPNCGSDCEPCKVSVNGKDGIPAFRCDSCGHVVTNP